MKYVLPLITTLLLAPLPVLSAPADAPLSVKNEDKDAHPVTGGGTYIPNNQHTDNPDAQWFPDAGMGLFLHWDEALTRAIHIGWSMIPGRALAKKRITDPAERARIVSQSDYNLDGTRPTVTPNQYWGWSKDFNPDNFHPDVWLKKVKEAGFTYVVLTTKHHNGFALWPSAYGDFNTKNYMGGRDLVKEFVEACRKNNLKVGLYFSGPDWHFDRDYFNFLYHGAASLNPEFPPLDADLIPRTTTHTPEELKAHHEAYAAMAKGQVEELLSNYGKIDLIWFDGRPTIPVELNPPISTERIRELQPGIVMNERFAGKGDFITPERALPGDLRLKSDEWGEFCNPMGYWSYDAQPFRPFNEILTDLAKGRTAGVNCLLGFGPMPNGELPPEAYDYLAKMTAWMKVNSEAIYGTRALPAEEKASVYASAKGSVRYLYLGTGDIRDGKEKSSSEADLVTFTGLHGPYGAHLLGDEHPCTVTTKGDTLTVEVPAAALAQGVRVLKLAPKI